MTQFEHSQDILDLDKAQLNYSFGTFFWSFVLSGSHITAAEEFRLPCPSSSGAGNSAPRGPQASLPQRRGCRARGPRRAASSPPAVTPRRASGSESCGKDVFFI